MLANSCILFLSGIKFFNISISISIEFFNWSKELKKIEPKLNEDTLKVFDLENSVKSKKSYGGTSFENVKKMIKKYKKEIK